LLIDALSDQLGPAGPGRELTDSRRFAAHELREIEQIVQDHRGEFLEAWNEYFGS
jgi:hypothetical protein